MTHTSPENIQLIIKNISDPQIALHILSLPTSGFKINVAESDLRSKLQVGTEIVISIVGLVISFTQLAVSIYQILQENKENKKESVKNQISVVFVQRNNTYTFTNQDTTDIIDILQNRITDDR